MQRHGCCCSPPGSSTLGTQSALTPSFPRGMASSLEATGFSGDIIRSLERFDTFLTPCKRASAHFRAMLLMKVSITSSPCLNIPELSVSVRIRSVVGDLPKCPPCIPGQRRKSPFLPSVLLALPVTIVPCLRMETYVPHFQNMPVTFSLRLTTAAKAMYQLGLRKTTMFTAVPWSFGFTFFAELYSS